MPFEKEELLPGYTIAKVSAGEFDEFYASHSGMVYPDVLQIDTDAWLSTKERADRSDLARNLQHRLSLHFLIYHGEQAIGWHCGYQIDADIFYMFETGVLSSHQRKGIYSALILWLLAKYQSLGFQKVTSQHHASNNAVIIPKLKAGFAITGFSIDEGLGLMVTMAYIINVKRMNAYTFRTGHTRPDAEIRKFL